MALFGLRMLVTLPAAYLLYRVVEAPVRARTWPRPGQGVRVAPALAVSLAVLGLVVTWGAPPPPAYLDTERTGELVVREAADAPGGTTSTTEAGPRRAERVLLVGDSIAASLEEALSQAFTARGVSFASIARPGCGVVAGVPASGPGQPVREMGGVDVSQCETTLAGSQEEAVAGFAPDLVLSISTWERIDRLVDGVWYEFGTPEGDAKLGELYGETIGRLSSGGARVALVLLPDNVAGRNAPFVGPTETTSGAPHCATCRSGSHTRGRRRWTWPRWCARPRRARPRCARDPPGDGMHRRAIAAAGRLHVATSPWRRTHRTPGERAGQSVPDGASPVAALPRSSGSRRPGRCGEPRGRRVPGASAGGAPRSPHHPLVSASTLRLHLHWSPTAP